MERAYKELSTTTKNIEAIVKELKAMQFGNWEIREKQMIFYDLEGNELARFDLFDKYGNPSDVNVFARKRR